MRDFFACGVPMVSMPEYEFNGMNDRIEKLREENAKLKANIQRLTGVMEEEGIILTCEGVEITLPGDAIRTFLPGKLRAISPYSGRLQTEIDSLTKENAKLRDELKNARDKVLNVECAAQINKAIAEENAKLRCVLQACRTENEGLVAKHHNLLAEIEKLKSKQLASVIVKTPDGKIETDVIYPGDQFEVDIKTHWNIR